MAAEHPDLRGSIFYGIESTDGYFLPPGRESRGKRAPTGKTYRIKVIFFHPQDLTYIQQTVSVYHELRFYQDYFHTHTLPEAIALAINPAAVLSPDIAHINRTEPAAYEFDATGAVVLRQYKMRNGEQRSERMELKEQGETLMVWRSKHYEDFSWTEFFTRYHQGSAVPEFVPRHASPYCEFHWVSLSQVDMYQEAASKMEYDG
eukprot:TRINITY_DN3400_c0_g1_i5.p1 TRINITY_DN3400_c0_g1~~TRINITY_DN3400_c0_g1_i5.p1  ORF type:complete len:227 (+),score=56.63 TRINITY_DN3400_c0_g1_i5:70-681(+)